MKTRDIKTKRPWKRIKPDGYLNHGQFYSGNEPNMPSDMVGFDIVTQADFLREFYPSGHAINDPAYYPDIDRVEEYDIVDENGNETGNKGKRYYREYVPRYAFAFQQIIAIKQIIHLCGNNIQFELDKREETENDSNIFAAFWTGWLEKEMEIAFYETVKSTKITADTAFVGYMDNGCFGWKVLSFKNGDTLYPHYDPKTGKMNLFARAYNDYDSEGLVMTEWLEVWDETNLTRFKRNGEDYKSVTETILGKFGFSGYKMESQEPHGFPFLPIAYRRDDDGACWTSSQESCDGYEMSFSQMAQNNQAFGFPILYLQGDEIEMQHDLNGSVKTIDMGPDDKAGYLNAPNASESFMKQLDTLYKMIYEQSFTVIPPKLQSGDLPAAALKILYSPAYEKAMMDSRDFQPLVKDMVKIFSYGYGLETERTLDFANLPLRCWIKPYVHVAESAMVTDLATAVQNGFCSRKTASQKIKMYTTVDEWDRIIKEEKDRQSADLLFRLTGKGNNDPHDGSKDKPLNGNKE